jgi:N-dimethylarginine dimethylaminohydrolase
MMTTSSPLTVDRPRRVARARRYLMCRPSHFDVRYAINPWMDVRAPVDPDLALQQWEELVRVYRSLGHRVDLIEPEPGLPDMVFAANAGTVIDGRVLCARFRHAERLPEEEAYRRWFEAAGLEVIMPTAINEGEGDVALVGDVLLAGWGFRSERAAHAEAAVAFARPVVSLQLVDPRYYHLDTALAVLDDDHIAYFPGAFSHESNTLLQARYPDAVVAHAEDADVLGLNATSDGHHVVLPVRAERLAGQLAAAGYEPHPVDLSELLKAGGSIKCCTLELRGSGR